MRFFILVILGFLMVNLTGCSVEAPAFKGYQNFKYEKLQENTLYFAVDVNIDNPNGFGVKVKRSFLDVTVGESYIGKARISQAFKIKRKRLNTVTIPFELALEKGAIFKLVRYITKREVDVKLQGVVRGAAFGIPRKVKIEETRKMNLKDLNLNLGI
jgi:LEA14-like dessication related protein